jgi:hypothetical protein
MNGINQRSAFNSSLLIFRTSNRDDISDSVMTETDIRRSVRLCTRTLVVTRRDYIPNCSEVRSSLGPPPARAHLGPGGRQGFG